MVSFAIKLLRCSLWVLLPPVSLFAIMSLGTGMSFGFALWSANDPWPTVLWFATLALPFLVLHSLKTTRYSLGRLALASAACWGFVIWYLFFVLD
jgi:hypothetical protein